PDAPPPPPARERRGARHPAAARPPASTRSSGRPGHGVGHRQRTLDPDTMLMSSPEITCPFTRPGERAIFRVGASKVPSTIAWQLPQFPIVCVHGRAVAAAAAANASVTCWLRFWFCSTPPTVPEPLLLKVAPADNRMLPVTNSLPVIESFPLSAMQMSPSI